MMTKSDLIQEIENNLLSARPDVQPAVLSAFRGGVWKIADLLCGLHPENILRWDGGSGDHSGQLAWDISGVRLTSEIDLLHAHHASPEVICEVDWKSGHKQWSATDIQQSFQFQTHAWLIFNNYPDVSAVETRILNTRLGRWSWSCQFVRHRDFSALQARLSHVVGLWQQYHATCPPSDGLLASDVLQLAPAWPSLEKCAICLAVLHCPVAAASIREVSQHGGASSGKLVDAIVTAEAKLKELKKIACLRIKGLDPPQLSSTDGKTFFGRNAPKRATSRLPDAKLYAGATAATEDTEEVDDEPSE